MSETSIPPLVRIGNGKRKRCGLYRCGACGKVKEIWDQSVQRRGQKSCGCLKLKAGGQRGRKQKPTKEYTAWKNIIARCCNPKHKAYKNYGARGITICERWRNSFLDFFKDVGKAPSPEHTLDRLKNHLNYEPGNVGWRTWKEQERNKRSCRYITHNGRRANLSEWAEVLGVDSATLLGRFRRNGVEKTFDYYLPSDGTPTIDHGRENDHARNGRIETPA